MKSFFQKHLNDCCKRTWNVSRIGEKGNIEILHRQVTFGQALFHLPFGMEPIPEETVAEVVGSEKFVFRARHNRTIVRLITPYLSDHSA